MTKIFTSAPTLADIHGYKGCVIAKVSSIKKRYNPLEDVWSGGVISEGEVRAADSKFIAKHKGQLQQNEISSELSSSKEYHVARIAWLVKNPLGEATSASLTCIIAVLTFQFGGQGKIKTEKNFDFILGNHSLAAAIIRGDEMIEVDIRLNDPDDEKFYPYAKGILGVEVGR